MKCFIALLICCFILAGVSCVVGEVSKSNDILLNSNNVLNKNNINLTGAMPVVTPAESAKKSDEEYLSKYSLVLGALTDIEDKVSKTRKMAEAPATTEIDGFDRDISFIELDMTNLSKIKNEGVSKLQYEDLQDRIYSLKLSLEILKKRWGKTNVFGVDFFMKTQPVQDNSNRPVPLSYRLRIGDKIRVVIYSHLGSENEIQTLIDSQGYVYVTGAGNVIAAGKTISQLKKDLYSRITSRFKQLNLDVSVNQVAPIQVQVAGDVARPGTFMLGVNATVINALYQAGGPTESGTFRKVELVRIGQPKKNIDIYSFLLKGDINQDVQLKDGDMIFVPHVGKTIIVSGEVIRPARYEPTFPINLNSVLELAGGAKPGGYVKSILVERVENGEYKVLMNANFADAKDKNDFIIKPGDQISISTMKTDRTNKIAVYGAVNSTGMFGYRDGMRVSDLVKIAQGLSSNKEVYGGRADILRIDPLKGLQIFSFNLEKALAGDEENNIKLNKLDRLYIYEPDQVVFRARLVCISGAIANPGVYKRTEGMTISDVVAAAGGVMPNAYFTRVELLRYSVDDTTQLIKVNLAKALSGVIEDNIKIQDRDEITIYTYEQVGWREARIRVEGAVQRPGVYIRSGNMRLSDALFSVGGLLPESSGIANVSRSYINGDCKIISVDIKSLKEGSDDDLIIEDRDVITLPSVNPALRIAQVVFLGGEVVNPGPYTLYSTEEKLSDLIAKAGGLTKQANIDGLLFLRQKTAFENDQQQNDVDSILKKTGAFADKQLLMQIAQLGIKMPDSYMQSIRNTVGSTAMPVDVVDLENVKETVDKSQEITLGIQAGIEKSGNSINESATSKELRSLVKENTDKTISTKDENKQTSLGDIIQPSINGKFSSFVGRVELSEIESSARISVNLRNAIADILSSDNIVLRNGDRLYVPKKSSVITVVGAVIQPHSFAVASNKSIMYYIERSGGFTQDAARGNVVVIRVNGDSLPIGLVKTVQSGDMIVVPNTGLIDIVKKWDKVGSITKVITDIFSSVFVLTKF